MIYVDSNVFILSFLSEDENARRCRSILGRIAGNRVAAFTSFLTWDEIVWSARKYLGAQDAVEQGSKFLEFPYLTLIEVSGVVVQTAQDLLERYRLKPRDAIHAGSALSKGIREFLTGDKDFDVVKKLRTRKPEVF